MNKLLLIVITIALFQPINVWAENANLIQQNSNPSAINTLDEEINLINNENSNFEYKQPTSKRKIAKKFLAAMGGVGLSSILLFLILSIYNRMRENIVSQTKLNDNETTLETPECVEKAVKVFLDKTNW